MLPRGARKYIGLPLYHASVRLSSLKRCNPVKKRLHETFSIQVNFSESHENYYSAYRYVCKNDPHAYKSADHPDLQEIGSPVTKKCMSAYRQKCRKRKIDENTEITANQLNDSDKIHGNKTQNASLSKVRRHSNLDVSKFLVKNNIRTETDLFIIETDLFIIATEQQEAGKEDLYNFLVSCSPKSLQDLIATTWKVQDAKASLARRRNTPRMDTIRKAAAAECVDACGGEWLECALQVLRKNGLHPIVFAEAVRDLLVNSTGKHRNIFIAGPADCAKTFILAPLQKIFITFSNPADNKYSWLDVENAEAIFLNDFRGALTQSRGRNCCFCLKDKLSTCRHLRISIPAIFV